MSVVVGGPYQRAISFVVSGNSVKLRHLRRDPRCSVLAVTDDWRAWVAAEGRATLRTWDDTDPERLRVMLREVYQAGGGRHPDYAEYDRVMRQERRAVVMVTPERLYGVRYET